MTRKCKRFFFMSHLGVIDNWFYSYINGVWIPYLKWCWNVEVSVWFQGDATSVQIIFVVYVLLCARTRLWPYQHDHTPVEDSSVISVTTGWTQQRFLFLMTAKKREKDEFIVDISKEEEVKMLPSISQYPKRVNTSCLLSRRSPPLSPTPEGFLTLSW